MSDERQDPVMPPTPEDAGPDAGDRADANDRPGGADARRRPPSRGGRRGRATRPLDPNRPCLNCGDPTPGEFCPTCGQRKVDVQVSVRTMVVDVLEDQFILDQRLPRTLGALLFKPGVLTVEHVNGRIVRYIRPFRLYLVSSVVFFLLLSIFSLQMLERADFGEGDRVRGAAADSLALARLDSLLADTLLTPTVRPSLTVARDSVMRRLERADSIRLSRREERGNWAEDATVDTGIERVDEVIRQRLLVLGAMDPKDAIRTVARDFFGYVPTMMFILLPMFAGVLKLLYIRRRRFYAEHFVFLLHVHSFVFIVFTVLVLLQEVGWLNVWLVLLLLGWTVVYIYLAMKRVYGQGWIKTFVKYWTLGWTYFWILSASIPLAIVVALALG